MMMDNIVLEEKVNFVIGIISSYKDMLGATYRILFWEKKEQIDNIIHSQSFTNINFVNCKEYRNGANPGIMFVEDKTIDEKFLKHLLKCHFNFEMAATPSINARVQICIERRDFFILLDIYDDRGFFIYYIKRRCGK